MRYLNGFVLTMFLGKPLLPVVLRLLLFCLLVFCFFSDEAVFCDYRIANAYEMIFRKRYYMNFLPYAYQKVNIVLFMLH